MNCTSLSIILFLSSVVPTLQNDEPKAVTSSEALSHIAQHVKPTVPPIAKDLNMGGKVKLHVSISPLGEVTAVKFVSGPPILTQAAIDAVKQWTFKPFLEGEKPIAVETDVEVEFPGGMDADEGAARRKYFPAEDVCRDLNKQEKYVEAEAKCTDAMALANDLPRTAVLERTTALSQIGNSIFGQRRYADAIPYYQQALDMNKAFLTADDADLATNYANLGRAYALMGNFSEADKLYGTAVPIFRAAMKSVPFRAENYAQRLKRVLKEFAQIKDAEGEPEAAADLRKQASEIP